MLGQFGITAGQFLETGVSLDGLGDELQLLRTDALAVVGAIFVPLKDVIRAIRGCAGGTLAVKSLLAEVTAYHGVDATDFLKNFGALLLDGG